MFNNRYFILYFALLCSSRSFAQNENSWQFVLTPVLWNASVAARLSDSSSGGDLPIDPDYRFFTLENLDDYLSLKFEASHRRFGLLFDSLRARYQDETANRFANFSVGTELGFVELAVRYQLSRQGKLDLIAGVRRTFLDIDQTLLLPMRPPLTQTFAFSWSDPLIGLRYFYPLSDQWRTWLRADIGGFGVGTQRSVNITADLQYLINTYVSFSIGYRYLDIAFKEDDVLYDVTLDGVQLGLGIHF